MSVKLNDTVEINYVGKFEDGETFDSSEGRDPLKFVVGTGQVIKGLDDAMIGMQVDEEKTIHIPTDLAYGHVRTDLIMKFPRTNLPEDVTPSVGLQLVMGTQDGSQIPVTITEVDKDQITIDANHALAGKNLIFDIKLISINE